MFCDSCWTRPLLVLNCVFKTENGCFGPNGMFLLGVFEVLNLTLLSFLGLTGHFRYFLGSGRLALIYLSGFSLYFACSAGLRPGCVNLTHHVLCYLPNDVLISILLRGFGLEMAILVRTKLFMWCIKGVKFNTFIFVVFHWSVYEFSGIW